jgi:Outer membrane lipoprotein carrier protein LolA
MQKLNNILIIFFIIFIPTLNAADKYNVFNELIIKIDTSKRLKVDYFDDNLTDNSSDNIGSIYIEKNNKFRIKIGQRIIASDGKTVWNYDLKNKKLIITNFENDEGQISIPNILMNLKNNYKPHSLKKNHHSSGAGIIWILELISKVDGSKIEFILDKNHKLKNITFSSEEFIQSWKIKSLHFDPPKLKILKLSDDSEFDIIDLR